MGQEHQAQKKKALCAGLIHENVCGSHSCVTLETWRTLCSDKGPAFVRGCTRSEIQGEKRYLLPIDGLQYSGAYGKETFRIQSDKCYNKEKRKNCGA